MRQKLILLGFALAAIFAASAVPTAAADTCPKSSHLIVCPTGSFCCPNNAFCVCFP
jgi:hypothetical protein